MTSAYPSPFTSPAVATAPPKPEPTWFDFRRTRRGRCEPAGRTLIQEDAALRPAGQCHRDGLRRAHRHIRRRWSHRRWPPRSRTGEELVRLRRPCGGWAESGRRAVVDEGPPLVRLSVVRACAPTITSEKPSPFTSPAVATSTRIRAKTWFASAVQAAFVANPPPNRDTRTRDLRRSSLLS